MSLRTSSELLFCARVYESLGTCSLVSYNLPRGKTETKEEPTRLLKSLERLSTQLCSHPTTEVAQAKSRQTPDLLVVSRFTHRRVRISIAVVRGLYVYAISLNACTSDPSATSDFIFPATSLRSCHAASVVLRLT